MNITHADMISDQIPLLLAGEDEDTQRRALAKAVAAWRDQALLATKLFASPTEMKSRSATAASRSAATCA